MAAQHGNKGVLTHPDGIAEEVIFWFRHPYDVIDFYTKDAKYIYMINDKLCVRDTRKPSYSFYTTAPDFDVDLDELEFTVMDDLEVIDILRLDLWES